MNRLTRLICVATLAGWLVCPDNAVAQRTSNGKSNSALSQDIISNVLRRSDSNGDGRLSPSETSSRTKDFIKKAGLDPNRTHMIQTVAQQSKSAGDKKNSKNSKSGSKSGAEKEDVRKVPGFGVDVELEGVADFSPTGEERMTVDAMSRKFGDSIMAQVNKTLKRYDTDKNGLIDSKEQKRTRWTNPSAEESDINKDGNLSRLELAYRYKGREDAAMKRSNPSSKNTSSKSTSRTSSSSGRFQRSRNSSRGSSQQSRNRSSSPSSSKSSAKPFNQRSDAYERYAEGLLKNYDKNKDNRLSKAELKEMRRPPENADTNKDGFVDKKELVASVSNRAGGNKSSSSAKSASSKSSSTNKGSERLRRDSKMSYNTQDSVFGGKDLNNDGQLQMSEFEKEWDDAKIAEFKAKDSNGDTVISPDEWRSR